MFISFEILHSFLPNLTLFAVLNFLIPNLYSLLLSVEFYLLLNFVQNRLEKMYQYFQNFNQDSLLITDNRYYLSKISRDNVKSELVFLLKTFYSIFNICAKINTMFSAQILLVIILTHVLLTCIAYVMTQAIITYLTDAAATLQYNVMYTNLYWFGFHWVMIVLIVVPCENINTLKRNIMKTVHQIIIEDKMPNLTLELEMFLMDLEKYNIQFTAHGFFSLEYSLFRKIIGAVATYWILLIQFQ
ncbi:gustatory receptor 68a-like isoform X3 [Diaphorina citri]|uniref:Gustatory receptor 68a-like isoform X2 n=1 Tax=Diaphorina citri TaxID=121845 RepID=A0A3Q0JE31_DIACI|nr:gustatory receptor 68a-like isoform X2 [Diaphorina citri]XP_026685254.1 gustatory receptor 68a-like isoform X3 [Diaphorina citri]